jgi:hypothetical protein
MHNKSDPRGELYVSLREKKNVQGKEFRKNPQTALIGPVRQLRLSKKGVLERGEHWYYFNRGSL